MIIDLAVVEEALDTVAVSERGRAALDQLSAALDDFRQQIGVEMNAAEFRYIMERLMAQRSLLGDQQPAEVQGFAFDAFSQLAFPRPGQSAPTVKTAAINQVLPGGFTIRMDANAEF